MVGILSDDGLLALRRTGHDAVAVSCAPDLPGPRLRFIDASLRSALESATEAGLLALFTSPFPERPLVVESRLEAQDRAVVALRVPPDLHCLRGHFRELPVIPGAIQLGWVLQYGAEYLNTSPTLRELKAVKFERLIQPGHSLELTITSAPASDALQFEFVSSSGRHASGQLVTGRRHD
jgi:3-hydroxymyristoyl/3-hydroxydecanoyl-(acyl carrier protein) dehydratase